MKPLRYILCALVAMSLAGLLQSCVYELDQKAETAKQSEMTLVLKASLLSGTRASDNQELMHSLRIVMLNEQNNVEFNQHLNVGGVKDYVVGIRTLPGKKKVYLIANEEGIKDYKLNGTAGTQSISDLLRSKSVGQSGFEEMVNGISFTPDFDANIVLSSMYEFNLTADDLDFEAKDVKDVPEEKILQFYLVRAATKFEFRLHNKRETKVHVDELTLSSIAKDMYLMPHVKDDFAPKGNMIVPEGKSYDYWIDWLKDVCDDTTAKPELNGEGETGEDNKSVNDKYGWIVDYEIPETSHSVQTLIPANSDDTWNIASGKSTSLTFYSTESQYTTKDYPYSFSLKVTDTEESVEEYKSMTMKDEKLYNLRTLFRNTHVIVDITLRYMPEIRIEVLPWVMREQKDLEFGDSYYDGIK